LIVAPFMDVAHPVKTKKFEFLMDNSNGN